MSEQMAAEIRIGGEVAAAVVPKLCKAVAQEGAALEWGLAPFGPKGKADLLEAREECDGAMLLCLRDDQARWGEFEALEAFLRQQGIAYDRYSDGKYEYAPELACFRPGRGLVVFQTDLQHEPIVRACDLVPVDEVLTKAIQTRAFACVQEAQQLLRKQLPPELPPLETFAIGED